jgi:hypothetical protein
VQLHGGAGQEVLLNPVRGCEEDYDVEVRLRSSELWELDSARLTEPLRFRAMQKRRNSSICLSIFLRFFLCAELHLKWFILVPGDG